jgi:hypothetical protein
MSLVRFQTTYLAPVEMDEMFLAYNFSDLLYLAILAQTWIAL